MATSGTLGSEDRRAWLIATLERDGAVRLEQAAQALNVSAMTVRRDLDELEGEGLLRRVRGGAVSSVSGRPFSERRSVHARAKRAIAEKALRFMPDSGAIALDASSTTGIIGAALGPRAGLTVATNSYDNFASVKSHSGVVAVLVGGEVDEATSSFVGLIACQAASSMLYQRFFASASAVDPRHGTSEVSLRESQVKRAFAEVSREIVLCIDSSKLNQHSVSVTLAMSDISVMITDLDPADERLDEYRGLVELV